MRLASTRIFRSASANAAPLIPATIDLLGRGDEVPGQILVRQDHLAQLAAHGPDGLPAIDHDRLGAVRARAAHRVAVGTADVEPPLAMGAVERPGHQVPEVGGLPRAGRAWTRLPRLEAGLHGQVQLIADDP